MPAGERAPRWAGCGPWRHAEPSPPPFGNAPGGLSTPLMAGARRCQVPATIAGMSEDTDGDRAARLAGLQVRLEAGEFGGALNMDSEPTAEQLGVEFREEFRLYGYATRVDRDPAVDFDGFMDDLWVLVASRFQLIPEEGDAWAGMPPTWRQNSDAPSWVWGPEGRPGER